jgi:hypothetical protein
LSSRPCRGATRCSTASLRWARRSGSRGRAAAQKAVETWHIETPDWLHSLASSRTWHSARASMPCSNSMYPFCQIQRVERLTLDLAAAALRKPRPARVLLLAVGAAGRRGVRADRESNTSAAAPQARSLCAAADARARADDSPS